LLPQPLAKIRVAAHCNRLDLFAVESEQMRVAGLAQPHRLFEHRLEHRCEVAGRGIDDL